MYLFPIRYAAEFFQVVSAANKYNTQIYNLRRICPQHWQLASAARVGLAHELLGIELKEN